MHPELVVTLHNAKTTGKLFSTVNSPPPEVRYFMGFWFKPTLRPPAQIGRKAKWISRLLGFAYIKTSDLSTADRFLSPLLETYKPDPHDFPESLKREAIKGSQSAAHL